MTRKDFLLAVDEMLDLAPATLHGPERLEDFRLWDSMAMVTFMALADSNNGIRLEPRELGSCETVNDLLRIAKVEI
jgi:acyl carrier protein